MIAAILRAQLLSMRWGASRGAVFGTISAIIWYGMWTVAAAFAGAFTATANQEMLGSALPLGFAAVCAYWQLVPILSASMGASLDMRKLLVYPVPHGKLFLVEILLRVVSAVEMLLVLAGGTIGLFYNRYLALGWGGLARAGVPLAVFVAFNLLLASGMRSVLERLLTRRKVREVLAIVMAMLWVLPRLLLSLGYRPTSLGRGGAVLQMLGFPWTEAARAMLPSGSNVSAPVPLLSLCGWTLAALWFGRTQFERSLRFDAVAAQATVLRPGLSRSQGLLERFYRLPVLLFRDPLAGMVEKELRSLARTPRFRMVFVMGFTFGLALWFPMIAGHAENRSKSPYFLIIVCVYAMTLLGQVSYWNAFGFDRSAVLFYFAAPQPIWLTLLGKNIASLFFIYIEVFILTGVTAALGLGAGWPQAVETTVVVGICALYMLGLGNFSSVHYPRGLNPERVSQGGASGRFQGLIFILYPLALLPVLLAYLARYAFDDSETIFILVMALAAVIGGVVYWVATDSAVGTAVRRREQIFQELSKGEGPVAAE